jgi:ankyrin repeat protein
MENIEEHLAEAIEENNADEVEKLLSVGKQINWTKEDQFGQSLLHRAAEVGSATVVHLILKKIDAEAL